MPPTAKKPQDRLPKAERLAAEANPAEPPKGAPALLPFHALSRSARAEWTAGARDAAAAYGDVIGFDGQSEHVSIAAAAAFTASVAAIERMILARAADPTQARQWVATCSDEDLLALWAWLNEQEGDADEGESMASPTS